MQNGIAALVITIALAAFLWLGQFRYAWHPNIEQDRFAGLSFSQVQDRLGSPAQDLPARPLGYESEPSTAFDRVVTYQPLWGQLQLYFLGERCVGSVFHSASVRF